MFEPTLTNITSDHIKRWALMKEFIEQWHEVKFFNLPISYNGDIPMSDGILRCLQFLAELQFTQIATINKKRYSLAKYIYHDMELCFGYDEDFEALLLFKQNPTRPIYWGIDKSNMMENDPNLVVIYAEETVKNYIKKPYQNNEITLTEYFIRNLMIDSSKPKLKKFATWIRLDEISNIIKELEMIFKSKLELPNAICFEKENALAVLELNEATKDMYILHISVFEQDNAFMKEIDSIFGDEKVKLWSDNWSRYKL